MERRVHMSGPGGMRRGAPGGDAGWPKMSAGVRGAAEGCGSPGGAGSYCQMSSSKGGTILCLDRLHAMSGMPRHVSCGARRVVERVRVVAARMISPRAIGET